LRSSPLHGAGDHAIKTSDDETGGMYTLVEGVYRPVGVVITEPART
jgi:hypothetical protein